MSLESLTTRDELYVRQQHELGELFGFETRNKYAIYDTSRNQLAFAAEQQKGVLGFLLRNFLGHWRTFEIVFFDVARQPVLRALHPFRFFLSRLELMTADGRKLGALQQRFSVLTKQFDVEDAQGRVVLSMKSGLFKLWTFPFFRGETEVARIEKRWSGGLAELLTDKDNFRVVMTPALSPDERLLVMAAAVFVDLRYFERKAN